MSDDAFERRADSARVMSDFSRLYRSRIYLDGPEELTGVWDTLEVPFESPGFPRGQLIFEAQAPDRERLVQKVSAHARATRLDRHYGRMEILKAPASRCRCRLYRVTSASSPGGAFFTEVWDTVEEPCEYRHELPAGELVAVARDFSPRFVRRLMAKRKSELGVTSAGTWNVPVRA